MEETKKKKDKTSIKKVLGGFLALVLVAVISIIGTLAYLSNTTGTKTNEFTGSEDISIDLTETDWDNGGDDKAAQYTPGLTIGKNPQIENDTTASETDSEGNTINDYSEWVAMRVDYKINGIGQTYAYFTNATTGVVSSFDETDIYDATNNANGKWIKIEPNSSCTFDIYVYRNRLSKGGKTTELFKSVTINNNITKLTIDGKKKYPPFTIDVKGAAIKNEDEFGTTASDGTVTYKDELTIDNLSYTSTATGITETQDYKIMDALVKLLTVKEGTGGTTDASDYTTFTGKTFTTS